jgi:hypothetical protein
MDKILKNLITVFIYASIFFYTPYVFFTNLNFYELSLYKLSKDFIATLLILFFLFDQIYKFNGKILIYTLILFLFFIYLTIRTSLEISLEFRGLMFLIFFYLILKSIYYKIDDLYNLIKKITIITVIVSLFAIYEYLYLKNTSIFSVAAGQIRVGSTLYHPNLMGWFILLSTLMSLKLIWKKNNLVMSYDINSKIMFFAIFINIIATFFSGSRSAFLILLFSCIIFFTLTLLYIKISKFIIFSFFIISVILSFLYKQEDIYSFRAINSFDTSRIEIYIYFYKKLENLPLSSILFGLNYQEYVDFKNNGLIDDSSILKLFSGFGLTPLIIMVYFFYSKINNAIKNFCLPDLLLILTILILILISNIIFVFPLWILIAIIIASFSANFK